MSKLSALKRENFPRVTAQIELEDYADDFAGDYVEVWLNWSREFQRRVTANVAEQNALKKIEDANEQKERFDRWLAEKREIYAEFWNCEPEEVAELAEKDPLLWTWISDRALELRQEFHEQRKKVESGSGDT